MYATYTGNLVQDRRVTLINGEGRNILRQTDKTFDNIQVIGIDTFAALSTGAYVLSENSLYTVEAFTDLFHTLKPAGILSFHRWLFHPPRETLRLSAIACEAWKRLGISTCDQHVMVIGAGEWATSLFKNEPFLESEVHTLAQHAAEANLSVLYWPTVFSPDAQMRMEQQYYDQPRTMLKRPPRHWGTNRGVLRRDTGKVLASYRYNVAPTTDDNPFFFEYHFLNVFGLLNLWV